MVRRLVVEHSAQGAPSHQTAALLLLATRDGAERGAPRDAWLDCVLRAQRWDGAFDGAPLYVVPRRGGVSAWYSSRLATTAICHRALVSELARRAARPDSFELAPALDVPAMA
jgi:hypothetical protein